MNGRELLSKFKYTRKLALLLGQVPLCVLSTGLIERYIQYRNKYLIEVRNTSSMKIIPLFLFDELTSLATCYVSFKYQKSGDFWFVCFRICVYVCSAFIKIKTSQNHILIKAEISYSSVGGCTMHNMFSLNVWLTSVPVPMTPRLDSLILSVRPFSASLPKNSHNSARNFNQRFNEKSFVEAIIRPTMVWRWRGGRLERRI